MKQEYTRQELKATMAVLRETFAGVRLLDPVNAQVLDEETLCAREPCTRCRNRGDRCDNCIGMLAISEKHSNAKMEYHDGLLYSIVAKYLTVDGRPLVLSLEMPIRMDADEDTVDLQRRLAAHNHNCGRDLVTRAYNRTYLEKIYLPSQMPQDGPVAVALIAFGKPESLAAAYGREGADRVLGYTAGLLSRLDPPEQEGSLLARVAEERFMLCRHGADSAALEQELSALLAGNPHGCPVSLCSRASFHLMAATALWTPGEPWLPLRDRMRAALESARAEGRYGLVETEIRL